MSFYCHLLGQLLLTSYRQPDGDLFGSQNGQIGAQMSPLDGSMRCSNVPTKSVPVHRPSWRDASCALAQLPAAQQRLAVAPLCSEKGLHTPFPYFDLSKESSQDQKDAYLKMEQDGTFSIEIG